ncbi:zinc-dependent metalloprotease [Terrimonas pollutisoli]|uniref:zinc-dependent metalloprotease n=1 Tax=Terrimonas pollutisoli TaxID=3034147 RepID=UPI0023EA9FA0|nr:zinc-dependent metalloprotease [Terrimonas sp. H1YJ31]
MSKYFLLLPLFAFTFTAPLRSQEPCSFDKKHDRLLEINPAYAKQIELNNIAIQKFITAQKAMKPGDVRPLSTVTIPVVVHVMHTGGAIGSDYNPSDAQIIGAINYLNEVYAGTYAGMTAPVEGGGVVDMEIQFALAQRTPTCGATNGIDRVDASSLPNYVANGVNASNTNGCPELTLKDLARWNTADYYNIWIVNKIDGADGTSGQFTAGFAYFPGSPSTLDGTIMLATQMVSGEKTLPHEIGHALNLHHPFRGSANNTQCPANANCNTDGDLICDTDPIYNNYNAGTGVYSFTCRTGTNTCTSTPYTINTESNFMSYTNCYTLFTNDQKTRAQAALTLPSRSSLIDAGNLALVPCGTTINFSQATASQTESSTGTPTGCRTYQDYTYQMVIGNGPSAAATATLSYSGTAVKGLDYDVTTNGSFTTPSDMLNFAAGSTTAQSFTIRIYDDGSAEPAETIILDFTVNDGNGDASQGTNAPTFTLTVFDNDIAPVGTSTGLYPVGTISTYITGAPFDARQQRQRGQYLYRADELLAAGINPGNITSLQLYVYSKLSTRPFTNLTIKMANTSISNLVDGSVYVIGGMSTVFTSSSYSTTAGWNNFTLSAPFAWTGNSLAIEICYDNTTTDAANAADQVGCYLDGGTASQANLFFQNNINCSGSFSSVSLYWNGVKPIIQLGASVTGTSIETAAGATSTYHIANGSSDYFYSNNNKLLMQLNNVSTSLGCVSSSLDAGGTTWINYQGGQRSAKVFAVTPTTNGASTNYTISLYFDNAELAGKNPATLKLAKTSAASAGASLPGNTILVTPTVTTLGSGTTIFTAPFTGFSRFFLVDGGVTLPATLTEFTGRLNAEQDALLSWTTASEFNNRQFDLETSRDGINFSLLAAIGSQGNAATTQEYSYLHIKPAGGVNYYRLKQIDWDGDFEYSKIISLNVDNTASRSFVYPVPAKNTITINFGSPLTKTELEIFSADMKNVRREIISVPSLTKTIDISSLSKGIYFIRYKKGDSMDVLRFIKE